ncbi:hypothetical protein [Cylindrospermum stagnale]|nr:hypothetical protein [Cylindrospermum stagnale]
MHWANRRLCVLTKFGRFRLLAISAATGVQIAHYGVKAKLYFNA